jgi:hypothetical protein
VPAGQFLVPRCRILVRRQRGKFLLHGVIERVLGTTARVRRPQRCGRYGVATTLAN